MQVRSYEPTDAAGLYAIYRRVTAEVPHCRLWPSDAGFATGLATPPIAGTEVFVAETGGAARGFAALASVRMRCGGQAAEAGEASAVDSVDRWEITACFAADEAAEYALIGACVERARALGAREVAAFPQEHGHSPVRAYNADWCGLSDRLRSLSRVLVRNGFAPVYRELHLACEGRHFPPTMTPAPPEIAVVAGKPEGSQQEVALRAMRGGEQVGVCVYGTLTHVTDDPAAQRWGYAHWLHVGPGLRRRGVARHLLTRALAEMAAQGWAGCWLTTGADNWAAQPLYLSLGFEIVDASACYKATPVGRTRR
jgi:ribosomal protein S18 acetylase RimI-like enzyme